jgi:hypothetical protein
MNEGVLYVATGKKYIDEALRSAKSVKENSDSISVSIVTDQLIKSNIIDNVIHSDELTGTRGEANFHFDETPYEKTIYLDTDTIVSENISDLFTLLDRFDIGAAHAPSREATSVESYPYSDIPNSFPEYNRGVLVYRLNDQFRSFLDDYQHIYNKHLENGGINNHDQPAMRKALYKSNLRIATLTPEYNCRGIGYADGRIRILHGRYKSMSRAINKLNSTANKRLYYTKSQKIQLIRMEDPIHIRFVDSLRGNGLGPTIRKSIEEIKSAIR